METPLLKDPDAYPSDEIHYPGVLELDIDKGSAGLN
jgi:hypothetical protein